MKQVLIIHGGSSFSKYEDYLENLKNSAIHYYRIKHRKSWKTWITEQMHDTDVLLPNFPNGSNAVYEEWKIYFEKLIPFLEDNVQLVGHSLGAMFLAKYLSENPLSKPIKRIILIAGGYDDDSNEDLGSFKVTSAKNMNLNASEVHLLHSEDDPVVPFSELAKFQADLPNSIIHVFSNYGHFNSETFPELLEILKQK